MSRAKIYITKRELVIMLTIVITISGAIFYRYIWKEEETRGNVESALINIKEGIIYKLALKKAAGTKNKTISSWPTPIPFKYEVKTIIGREYFPEVRRALREARRFIKVAMFVIDRGNYGTDPANVLVEELIAARRRGVAVSVVLEHPWKNKAPELKAKNSRVIEYLRRSDVDADFDEPNCEMHDKLVIIDDRIIFIGNHNWTKEALTINDEVSVCIRPEPPDPQFTRQFNYISRLRPEETEEGKEKHLKELQEALLKRSGQR